jgi:heptosyltransferase III
VNLRRNVLIFHAAALGDFILTWPIAMAVGRVLAQSRIHYVTAAQKGELAERLIQVESSDVEAGWHGLHQDDPSLPERPAKLVRGMQMGIVFSQTRDERFIANLQKLAGAEVPMLHLSPNPPAGVHVWQHQLDQLQSSPMLRSGVEQMQRLIAAGGATSAGKQAASDAIVIHPGSGAERKNWPIERFVEVASQLKSSGRRVVFTLGEVERERFGPAVLGQLDRAGEVRRCDSLRELCDAIAGCAGYIGNDSGPTHLAAFLGKPTVGLFGPTSDPAAWRPMGPRVTVLAFEASPVDVVRVLLNAS